MTIACHEATSTTAVRNAAGTAFITPKPYERGCVGGRNSYRCCMAISRLVIMEIQVCEELAGLPGGPFSVPTPA
jgi:hypothetical protein